MGKRKMDDELPSLRFESGSKVISEVSEKPVAIAERVVEFDIRIPAASNAEGYATRRIDTSLNQREALAFKAVLLAMKQNNTRLRSGRYVKKPADVYRWIAEQIAEKYADNN